ncbi:MAG: hypothetical protein GWN87_06765, partial [Desulfuromonadales bacterium]|nr:hypothetical protein [Desulfuromonadales bacterium]
HLGEIEGVPKSALDDCLAAFIASYEGTSGRRLQLDWLEWHIAAALLLRAKVCTLQQVAEGWPEHLDFALSRTERLLWEGRSMPAQRDVASFRENVA